MPKEYSQEVRERAYRIWAFEANRKAELAVERLSGVDLLGDDDITGITPRTIRNWVREDNWNDRANRETFAMGAELKFAAESTLALAAPEAAVILRQVMATDPMVERHYLVKDADGTHLETRIELDVNILKVKANAAQLLLDRSGFSPVGTRDVGQLSAPPIVEIASDDRLRALMLIEDRGERERQLVALEAEIRGRKDTREAGIRDARSSRAKFRDAG